MTTASDIGVLDSPRTNVLLLGRSHPTYSSWWQCADPITLCTDGGGVRGISALVILQSLMREINTAYRGADHSEPVLSPEAGDAGEPRSEPYVELQPYQVFKLVAGTSTGGLISLMLGKLGMSADECLEVYKNFAKRIFGSTKWRDRLTFGLLHRRGHVPGSKKWRGSLTAGLSGSRYRAEILAECIQELLRAKAGDENLRMIGRPQCSTAW